ncbi:MAG: hypothetical protein LQ338_005488 [Usnochroma carphineum]|nr:MAG: hypothetical protein LQ338_005488 [Usnochroma carphineum]
MSPPPRHGAEDYWNSHASHGSKKKRAGASRLSPSGENGQNMQAPTVEIPEKAILRTTPNAEKEREIRDTNSVISKLLTATDESQRYGWLSSQVATPPSRSQVRSKIGDQPQNAILEGNTESPTITSLKRLSVGGARRPSNGSTNAEYESSNALSSAIKHLLTTSENNSQTRKQSIGDQATAKTNARRRSSAFRDGDRRRPGKEDAKAAVSGLALPATITLRKATGLFHSITGPEVATNVPKEASVASNGGSLSYLTTCSLIAFDSKQLGNPEHVKTLQEGAQIRKQSIVSTKGLEFSVPTPATSGAKAMSSGQQCLAAPVLTIASIYPSPAILASPAETSSPPGSLERRFSVVQMDSRKSVHRVIWCEDDDSSSTGTCSAPISPTEDTFAGHIKLGTPSENSPDHGSDADSRGEAKGNSKATSHEDQNFAPDIPVDNESRTPMDPAGSRAESRMFQWSWGAGVSTPMNFLESIGVAYPFQGGNDLQAPTLDEAPPAIAWSIPQLIVPHGEDSSALSLEPAMVRRGSFLMDPSTHASIGAGRELGSRRSISIRPLALSKFASYEANDEYSSSPAARRPSRRQADMAPDLNTVPPSPRVGRNASTSISSNRSPEPVAPSPNAMPPPSANPLPREPPSVGILSSSPSVADNAGVGTGPGPLRHPRPLTAADLHMQLEKEQEAVVNRLTRELSLLRQQTASVASTTSSTSAGLADPTDHSANHLMSGASHPTSSRRHRSSSSLSTRSINTAATTASGYTGFSGSTVGTTGGVAGSTVSGIAPARDGHGVYPTYGQSLSRQNSTASSRRSQASSPSLSSSLLQGDHFPNLVPLRHTSSSQANPQTTQSQHTLSPAASARSSHVPSSAATARYEETAHQRAEMESVKRENENLRRRIRELERTLARSRHTRSDSESTGTGATRPSATTGHGHDASVDYDEDAVHVGESAGSAGVGGGH